MKQICSFLLRRGERFSLALASLVSALLLTGTCALAAVSSFPSHPEELSIVFTPGGALDAAVRVLAKEAEKTLGVAVIPQNNPGGGGMPGVAKLAAAAPDGYHLGACVSNALIFIPHRNAAPYRPLRDVEPVLIFGQAAPVLVTKPGGAWKDMESFLAATRASKGELRIGVPGLGTPSHIALAMISRQHPDLTWRFVPFGGPCEAEAALLGGHVDAAASGALPRIRGGQLQPLMALAGKRLPALPATPSLTDLGFADPGQGDSSFVLLAPSGTPDDVLSRLEQAFLEAARSEAFLKVMSAYSVTPVLKTRAEARAFLREAWNTETDILRAVGLADKPATQPE